MLTQVEDGQNHNHLFVPTTFCEGSTDDVKAIIKMIAGWKPSEIGFYVAPEVFKKPGCHHILRSLIREIVDERLVPDIYMFTGSHGFKRALIRRFRDSYGHRSAN